MPVPNVGLYSQSASLNLTRVVPDDPTSAPCPANNVTVANRPYFKVLGGDIISLGTNSVVAGWNQFGGTYPGCTAPVISNGQCGAGVEGFLLAANQTLGVKSGLALGGTRAATLSNTSGNATWGGAYGDTGGFFSAPSYGPSASATDPGPTLATGAGGITVPANTKVEYYRAGSVRITGSGIRYAPGAYGNMNIIPHFRLIATGDIYISSSVTQLDGEYISTGGSVYTCHDADAWGSPINTSATNIYAACSANNLVVNGSLVGRSVRLTRTKGTLRNATDTDITTNSTNIAEIIQFSPEIYLSPSPNGVVEEVGSTYDSLSALPPLL
jgi:hypothetical protein